MLRRTLLKVFCGVPFVGEQLLRSLPAALPTDMAIGEGDGARRMPANQNRGDFYVALFDGPMEACYEGYKRVLLERSKAAWRVDSDGTASNRRPITFQNCTYGQQRIDSVSVLTADNVIWFTARLYQGILVTAGITPEFGPGGLRMEISEGDGGFERMASQFLGW
jgi:hypothetical protein